MFFQSENFSQNVDNFLNLAVTASVQISVEKKNLSYKEKEKVGNVGNIKLNKNR